MPDDGDCQGHTAMDSSDTQTRNQKPSTSSDQQPGNLGATGQPGPAISFAPDAIANLLQAASAGNFWDVPDQLKGATAAQVQELQSVLQNMASNQKPAETDPDKDESEPEKVVICVHRSSESASTNTDSDTASDADSHKDTTQEKKKKRASVKGVKDLFEQAQDDVFVVSDESGDECGANKGDESCSNWATQVKAAEPDGIVRYPNATPYVHSKAERTEDVWYRGEVCASSSEVATSAKHAILPAADGSLALKADAVLPSAPPGHDKFGDRVLDRRVYHDKAKRKGHEELDPITQAELKTEPRKTERL